MKTATVRQVRHDFGSVLNWIEEGEQVKILKRGKIVALMLPPPIMRKPRAKKRPDFAQTMRTAHTIALSVNPRVLLPVPFGSYGP